MRIILSIWECQQSLTILIEEQQTVSMGIQIREKRIFSTQYFCTFLILSCFALNKTRPINDRVTGNKR